MLPHPYRLEKAGRELVTAHIAVKVTPNVDRALTKQLCALLSSQRYRRCSLFLATRPYGAGRRCNYPGYRGLSPKLAVMDSVVSCTTHFVLKKSTERRPSAQS